MPFRALLWLRTSVDWTSLFERQEGVVQVDGSNTQWPRMTAAPCPISFQIHCWTNQFVGPILAGQVPVDSPHGMIRIPRFEVSGHEANRVPPSILPDNEAVDPLFDVLTTQVGVASCYALALNDRVRVLVLTFFKNGENIYGNVGEAIWYSSIRCGTGLHARRDKHLWPSTSVARLHDFPHSVAQTFIEF